MSHRMIRQWLTIEWQVGEEKGDWLAALIRASSPRIKRGGPGACPLFPVGSQVWFAVVFALMVIGSGIASGDDPTSQVATNIQGEWVGIELEIDGKKLAEEEAKVFRASIKADEIILRTCRGENCIERKKRYRLESARTPMWIDLDTLDGKEKGSTQLSIFSLDKDELKLCSAFSEKASSERPTEFKTKPGDGMLIVVFRRVASK